MFMLQWRRKLKLLRASVRKQIASSEFDYYDVASIRAVIFNHFYCIDALPQLLVFQASQKMLANINLYDFVLVFHCHFSRNLNILLLNFRKIAMEVLTSKK